MADDIAFAASTMNDGIVSSLELIHEPEVYRQLVGRFPNQRNLGWLKTMGKYKSVNQTTFSHHEENTIFNQSRIASFANATADVAVTLTADSHAQSGANSYARVGDLVIFRDGTQGYVLSKNTTTPNAHILTIRKITALDDVQSAPVNGENFIIQSNAFDEGTEGRAESIIPTTTVFNQTLQVFSDKFEVTSSEKTNQTYLEFTNKATGQTEKRYYIKGEADTADRFVMNEELGLFTNRGGDGTLLDVNGNAIRTTEGMIPRLEKYANLMDYTSQPTQETYDRMIKIINKNYGAKEYLMCEGLNFSIGNRNFHTDFGKNGAIVYNSFKGGKDGAVKLGFSSMAMNGYTFHTKALDILNHADTTGAEGFPYADYCILMPTDAQMDPNTKKYVDSFSVRYKSQEGNKGSRGHFRTWKHGGMEGTNGNNRSTVSFTSEKAFQLFGAKRFILIKKK